MRRTVLGVAVAVLLAAGPAVAHHSFAMFDYNKDVTIVGQVKELRWTNPHIHILVNVPDNKGGTAEWDVEGGTPGNLRRQGWSRDVVKPGDKISIVIHPMKDGTNGGQLVKANKGDGTQIGTGGAGG
jgi:Family of unknown function (DUF6152)